METLTAARNAMATRFEMVLHGDDPVRLRAAADQAFQEIERLHAQLSLYLPSSEISFINSRAFQQPVQVEPELFALLQLAQRIHEETGGTFDITIAPLIRAWGFMDGPGSLPSPAQVAEARAKVGMHHLVLNARDLTVRFERPGMMLDLGSIGKGFALDVAMQSLQEAGVPSALLHGGTSTVYALGAPPGMDAWNVAIDTPPATDTSQNAPVDQAARERSPRPLAVVTLRDEALSVSAVHGKFFHSGGKTYGHVMDPRTGAPTQGALLAAAALPSATETDAFSTALLVAGIAGHESISALRTEMRTFLLANDPDADTRIVVGKGIAPLREAPQPLP